MLKPAGRLAHRIPVRHVRDECPFRAPCFRRVLPQVMGFPHRRVLRSIRLPTRIRWAFLLPVLLRLPDTLVRIDAQVPALFRLRVSPSVPQELSTRHRRFPPAGASGVSQVLQRLSSCMPRPEDSGGPFHPRQTDGLVLPSVCVKTLGVRDSHFEAVPALQGTRLPLRPTGYSVYASSILFAASSLATPPWTQDSIRVGGYPLPDRDFHPARDAKLFLAR